VSLVLVCCNDFASIDLSSGLFIEYSLPQPQLTISWLAKMSSFNLMFPDELSTPFNNSNKNNSESLRGFSAPSLSGCRPRLGDSGALRATDLQKDLLRTRLPTCRKSRLDVLNKELTVNKLSLEDGDLVGRETEKRLLEECIQRSFWQNTEEEPPMLSRLKKQVILIHGVSGCGKSSLLRYLSQQVQQFDSQRQGMYMAGKFDMLRNQPYQGIVTACNELVEGLIAQSRDKQRQPVVQDFAATLEKELGLELSLLYRILPSIQALLLLPTEEDDDPRSRFPSDLPQQQELDQPPGETKQRLVYAFRRLFRILSDFFQPLCLVLDDMQWSDMATIDLVESLITDKQLQNLLIALSYRSEEAGKGHPLRQMLNTMNTPSQKDDFGTDGIPPPTLQVTDIAVGDLTVNNVHEMLQSILSLSDSPKLQALAETCHKKTHGNPFFFKQYLSMLQSNKLLHYSLGACTWVWNVEQIQEMTMSTNNVVSLLEEKNRSMSKSLQLLLFLASCLGATFEKSILELVWKQFANSTEIAQPDAEKDAESSTKRFEQLCHLALEHGFWDPCGNIGFQFVHDKIQEAASSSISNLLQPRGDNGEQLSICKEAWKTKIGWILIHAKDVNEKYIFVAVDLLNQGVTPASQAERKELSELNLKAAVKARDVSAFSTAADYAMAGIDLLPRDEAKWDGEYYNLSLRLYSTAAAMHGCVGKITELSRICNEVINLPKCPIMDKLPLYNALIDSLGNTGRNHEALDLSFRTLKMMGIKFPKKISPLRLSLVTIAQLWRAQQKIKSKRTKPLKALPKLEDPKLLAILQQLDQTFTFCHHCFSDLLPMVVLRQVQLSYQNGLSPHSLPGFATMGLLFVAVLEDFDAARSICSQTLNELKKPSSRPVRSRTMMLLHGFVQPWITPMQSLYAPLLYGYELGMNSGDIESSTWNAYLYLTIGYLSGRNLERLHSDCAIYVEQMKELKRDLCAQHW
jgi:predicted ATPase